MKRAFKFWTPEEDVLVLKSIGSGLKPSGLEFGKFVKDNLPDRNAASVVARYYNVLRKNGKSHLRLLKNSKQPVRFNGFEIQSYSSKVVKSSILYKDVVIIAGNNKITSKEVVISNVQ